MTRFLLSESMMSMSKSEYLLSKRSDLLLRLSEKHNERMQTTSSNIRAKASSAQLSSLAEHMQAHPELAAGISHTLQGRLNLEGGWKILADNLNSMGGAIKTVAKWKQAWRDMRNNVKKKASHNATEHRGYGPNSTGNGPSTLNNFSEVDEKVLSVMGPVAVYGLEDVASTEPSHIPELVPEPVPVLEPVPEPVPVPVPRPRKRRRVVPQHDSFDERLLQIEEQKLQLKQEKNSILREKNEILNRHKTLSMIDFAKLAWASLPPKCKDHQLP